MELQLHFAYNKWFLILGIFALSGFAWWVYKYTVPPVSSALRKFLLMLRIVSVVLIFLLIFEPIFAIAIKKTEKPVIALLLDNSASMQLADSFGTRAQHLQALLSQRWLQALQKRAEILPIAFADSVQVLSPFSADSIKFNHEGTNLQSALTFAADKLTGRNYAAALLFSDGIYNIGSDPTLLMHDYPVPVYTVALGKDTPDRDTWISEVVTNEVAFSNTNVPLEVMLRSTGFANKPAVLTLRRNGVPILTQKINLPPDLEEKKVRLNFTPTEVGMQKFEVELAAQNGELTPKNNRRSFYIKVLKSKFKIFVVAGMPGPDVSFLLRTLRQDKNLSVKSYIAISPNKSEGSPLPGAKVLKTLDCVVAVNLFSTPAPPKRVIGWLNKAVLQEKKPLFFISGPIKSVQSFWRNARLILLGRMPVHTAEKQVVATATLQGLAHPILRVKDETFETRELLADLPPVFYDLQGVKFQPGAQVLLTAHPVTRRNRFNQGQELPLLATLRRGDRRIVAFMGAGFWRWQFMMQRLQPGHDFYEKLMVNAIRWLVSAEESKLLKVTANKEIYRTGEKIIFTAQAYYEDFSPRDNLDILVKVIGKDITREVALRGKGNGLYEGELNVLEGGDYRFRAVARAADQEVGRDQGKFTVDPFKIEFQRTVADKQLLRKLARLSGGNAIGPDSLSAALQNLRFENRIVYESRQFPLWQRWPMLLLIVLTLSLEWYVRKRKGML